MKYAGEGADGVDGVSRRWLVGALHGVDVVIRIVRGGGAECVDGVSRKWLVGAVDGVEWGDAAFRKLGGVLKCFF